MLSIRRWENNRWNHAFQKIWDGEKWDYNFTTPLKWNGKEWAYHDLDDKSDFGINGYSKKFVTIYEPTWYGVYDQDGVKQQFTHGLLYHGTKNSFNIRPKDNKISVVGFDYKKIQNDLIGSKIEKVELFLSHVESGDPSGSYLKISNSIYKKMPNQAAVLDQLGMALIDVNVSQSRWVELPTYMTNNFLYGVGGSLVLSSSNKKPYNFGSYHAKGAGAPRLRLTYSKIVDKDNRTIIPKSNVENKVYNYYLEQGKADNKPSMLIEPPKYYTVPKDYDLKKVTEELIRLKLLDSDFYLARKKLMDLNGFSSTAPVLQEGDQIIYKAAVYR